MKSSVLIADDDDDIRNLASITFKNDGFDVTAVASGRLALQSIADNPPHLVVLDVTMDELDGYTTCTRIRAEHTMPILFLSARVEEIDRLRGLSVGGDDYLVKPFSTLELVARGKALIRRYRDYGGLDEVSSVRLSDVLRLDIEGRRLLRNGQDVPLTPKEFGILALLARSSGRVFSLDQIHDKVWGDREHVGDNTIMVHIKNLRYKIEDDPRNPVVLKTVYGFGYKI